MIKIFVYNIGRFTKNRANNPNNFSVYSRNRKKNY